LIANASQTLRTDQATLSATQINVSAHDLSNVLGEISQVGSGDLTLNLPGALDNTQGRIATNSDNLNLAAATLTNTDGTLEHAGTGGLRIEAVTLNGQRGRISGNGLLDLTATIATLDDGTASAAQVQIGSRTFSNRGGMLLQTGADAATITASARLDNTGGVIASNGSTILTVGDLANQGGTIQAAGSDAADLRIIANGSIDNSNAGKIGASGTVTVAADSLDNIQGQVTASQGLHVATTQALANAQGLLAANQQVSLSASRIDNTQGTIGSVQDQTLVTAIAGDLDNSAGRIEAAQAVQISSLGMNNTEGIISGSRLSVDSNAQEFDNIRGKLTTTGAEGSGALDIQSGALNNEEGLIQAAEALAINTHGQTLVNTHSGNSGGIIGQGSVHLATGDIDNRAGYIGSNGALTAQSGAIANTGGGVLVSATQMNLNGSSLDNQGGQIQAAGDIGLSVSGALDNTSSLVRSGQTLNITAAGIVNADTQGAEQGLEGQSVSLSTQQINNQRGAVRADNALTMTSHGSINNIQGLISSGEIVTLQDSNPTAKALAITNTTGTVIAGQQLNIDSAGLTGDGKVLSKGDLNVEVTQNYTHTGELQADGSASLETTGILTNQSTLLAGTALNLKAATINNQANGEISANQVNLKATGNNTLTNRGLINGQDTVIETTTLNNLGTGRIYGDHLAISATTVTNNVENGFAPVIAARDRLDIAAANINNREHALLFSAGDLAVGGGLDADKHAIGQASTLNNNSATIEALGDMAISAATVNNTNDHFSTQTVTVSTAAIDEIQGYGTTTRIDPGGRPPRWFMTGLTCYAYNMPGCSGFNAYWYRYNHTVTETRQLSSDPARIWAGGGIAMNIGQVNNDKSQIIAGGNINVSGGSVTNTSGADQRTTTDSGTATHYFSAQPSGGGSKLTITTSPYTPAPTVQAISSNNPMVYRQNTAPAGTGARISARITSSVNQAPSGANVAEVTINNGQVITPITQVTALDGNNGNGPATVVRSGGVNTTVPNNSLFSISPNPNSSYLIETDPRFVSYQQWLSSDYLLSALASSAPAIAESHPANEPEIMPNSPESDSAITQYCPVSDLGTAQNYPAIDPTIIQKRLGDGFYEQRLIREQVAQLTGRRFLEGYADDEAQYLALMNNAVTFARAHQLRPGIVLSAEQMAQLTSDIVWLVEKNIALANGQTAKALVPQVYVRVQDGDFSASGALMVGSNVTLDLVGDIINGGTIAGRNVVALTAENVANLDGRIAANDVGIMAHNDLDNLGGVIEAANSLAALAGRDLNVVSTTSTQTNTHGSRTNINRVAGLYMTGSGGTLLASAGRDMNLVATEVVNTASTGGDQLAGSTELVAGRDLNLGAVSESQRHDIVWASSDFRKDSSSTDVGTTIQTQGDIRIQAGNDLNAKAANLVSEQGALSLSAGKDFNLTAGSDSKRHELVWDPRNFSKEGSRTDVGTAIQARGDISLQTGNDLNAKAASVSSDQGALSLNAGRDLNLAAGSADFQHDEASFRSRSSWGSKKEITTRDSLRETTALGSSFSGENITAYAGHDLNLTGGNVVATNAVTLAAGNNIKIEAAANSRTESHFRQEKKSGLLGSGGIGFTIGSQTQSIENKGASIIASAATVGSTQGNVAIAAGNDYQQTGSEVLAPQGDIDISAKKIDIVEAQNTSLNTTETRFKQSGLTMALTSPVISAVQTAQHMSEAASQTKDARMQALAGATVALNAKNAYDAVKAGQAVKDGSLADKAGGVSVSISVGSSSSQSNSTQTSSTAQGSTVAAGNNVNLTATGAGKDSDLTVQGSQVTAGSNVTLKADDEINLLAAKNTAEQHSINKSSSGSIGMSFGSQTGVTLAASQGRGNADGSDVSWTNTHVEAGNTLALQSGNDTTLKGAVASGKQVVADVGGNLNVESMQDTSQYASRQKSLGGSVTIGPSPSGSISASKSKIDSNYASVVEQSGIKAGDEGFQVNVNGNTDLKGAVIASTDKAVLDGKNILTTATLTTSDIQNQASYSAKSVGANIGAGVSLDGKLAPSGSGAGMGKDSGDASSTTQAGISGIAGNTAVRTGDAETGIAKIFDADEVQREINAQVQITQAFSQQVPKAVADYAAQQTKPYLDARNSRDEANALLDKETDPEKKTQLRSVVAQSEQVMDDNQAAYDSWKENGSNRIAANIIVSAMSGGVSGAAGSITKESLSWAADQMRQAMIEDSKNSPGIIDKNDYVLDNKSGKSVGVNGDNFKLAGGRVDVEKICGADRCEKNEDGSLKKNEKGQILFIGNAETGDNLKAYVDANPDFRSQMGGLQGKLGQLTSLLGDYAPGSLSDKVAEAYSGTHDTFNSPIWYGPDGNIKPGMTTAQQAVGEVTNYLNVIPATPFALSVLLPPEVWNAIQVGIKVVKP
jgi:filamentous hemagglutinin